MMRTGNTPGYDRSKVENGHFTEQDKVSIGSRILRGVGALVATVFTLGVALASPTIRDLWYSAFTGRVKVIKKEDIGSELPTQKTDTTFQKTISQEQPADTIPNIEAPVKPTPPPNSPPNSTSETQEPKIQPSVEIPPISQEKQPELPFKSDEEIKKIFAGTNSKPQTSETKILKNRLREIINNYYKPEAIALPEDEWERSIELFAKIYNMIKQSYGLIATNPKHNILQRTDRFVCLEDEDIVLLKKNKLASGISFTLANTWRELLWLAFANVQTTPIPGIKIHSNMYDLSQSEMSKLLYLALNVANSK